MSSKSTGGSGHHLKYGVSSKPVLTLPPTAIAPASQILPPSPLPRCLPCPSGTSTPSPGTASSLRCLMPSKVGIIVAVTALRPCCANLRLSTVPPQVEEELQEMFSPELLIKKLVSVPALDGDMPKSKPGPEIDGTSR